jgi:hypothetical protein
MKGRALYFSAIFLLFPGWLVACVAELPTEDRPGGGHSTAPARDEQGHPADDQGLDTAPAIDGAPALDAAVRPLVPDAQSPDAVSAPPACTIYVGLAGSGGNAGNGQRRFDSIGAAAEQAEGGDTVCVAAGDYGEDVDLSRSGSPGSPVGFYAQGKVVVRSFDISADHVVVSGFEVTGSSGSGVSISGRHVTVQDNNIHHTGTHGILCSKSSGCSDAVIRNNIVTYFAGIGITIFGSNVLVEGNDISHGLDGPGDTDGIRFFGDGHVMRGNVIHDIVNAEAGGAHTDCFQTFDTSHPPVTNIVIDGNICTNVDHQCIMAGAVGTQSRGVVFSNNVCDINGWQAVFFIDIAQVTVSNNVFTGNIRNLGVILQGAPASRVINNIFYQTPDAYMIDGASQGTVADYNRRQRQRRAERPFRTGPDVRRPRGPGFPAAGRVAGHRPGHERGRSVDGPGG